MAHPLIRLLSLLLLLALFGTGLAQRCLSELQGGLSAEALERTATGRDAARLLARAVALLEPAMPPLTYVNELPVEDDDPDFDTFRFLAERQILPPTLQPGAFSLGAWQVALARLASWYELPAPSFDLAAPTNEELIRSLADLIESAGSTLDPVALLATDPDDSSSIAFWATIRNRGIYPRMVVVHPPAVALDLSRDLGRALELLSTCAVTPTNYVYAPADTAQRLFLANNEARMVVARTEPPSERDFREVALGEESAYLTFAAPEIADKARYTALFIGPGVGLTTLLRLLPQVRTNMNPREIVSFLSGS